MSPGRERWVKDLYRIGVFSKISKTTIKTLRYYDEIGLLKPAQTDCDNGYRYYTTDQLVTLHRIVALRQIGLSLDEVAAVLNGIQAEAVLKQRKSEIEARLKETRDQLSRLNHYILEMKEGKKMNYNAVVKELPECIVYSKRFIAPSYDSYFALVPAIGAEVKAANPNLKCAVPEYCFIEYHDSEYKEKNINIEYCEAVVDFGVATGTIKFKKIPAITAVSVMHKGPYSGLKDAYAFTYKWIEENGYNAAGNPRESYIDGIWNKEDEADWLTELQVPVLKK
ncbi:MAG: MerR family transcriptional regulator [Desulfotomaculaceae bacterium]|nr:MerR family transcriptional regulator [Desulfotomaculaceae bacterium]